MWSISTPPRPNREPGRRPVPSRSHRLAGVRRTTHGRRGDALVRDVLDADERGLGTIEVAPALGLLDDVAAADDAPEEVVRREEHEIAAEVAVSLDEVVLARRHVLVVTREDDQVVRAPERGGAARRARGPTARGSRRACLSSAASAGSRGGTDTRTARRDRGMRGPSARCSGASPRTTSRPLPSPSSSRKL